MSGIEAFRKESTLSGYVNQPRLGGASRKPRRGQRKLGHVHRLLGQTVREAMVLEGPLISWGLSASTHLGTSNEKPSVTQGVLRSTHQWLKQGQISLVFLVQCVRKTTHYF